MIRGAITINQFSNFWSKISGKQLQSSLNPFTKERRDLHFWRNGVIFQGEFDGDAQNVPAFPKRGNHGSIDKILWKLFDKKIFGRRKMKRRESSETRFGQVWTDQSHPRGVNSGLKFSFFQRRMSRLHTERRVFIRRKSVQSFTTKVSVGIPAIIT